MGVIRMLSEELINKIAAGEVVERPASVVKELVDNAVDAGATSIVVRIEEGGAKKILVMDDGRGMDGQDVRASVRRHGTSKISSMEELERVGTMGFRGEALASIGAVSRLTIRSKREEDVSGTELVVEGGIETSEKKVGMATGTVVLVEQLFFNVPVRKKFLKSGSTELRHVVEMVSRAALGNPEIGFELWHGSREILRLNIQEKPVKRVVDVLGEDVEGKLVEVVYDHPHLQVRGWVGKPQTGAERGVKQYLLVNRRSVSDKTVVGAVKQALGSLVMPRVQVPWVLYVSLPHEMVDVNVHPRKEEVRWVNGSGVFKAVKGAVEAAFAREDLRPVIGERSDSKQRDDREDRGLSYDFGGVVREARKDLLVKDQAVSYGSRGASGEGKMIQMSAWNEEVREEGLPWEREKTTDLSLSMEIVQLHHLYLITSVKDGMKIVDQHAAHERIRFEELVEEFKGREKHQQGLLVPEEVVLSVDEVGVLEENLEVWGELGFDVELMGNCLRVSGVPMIMRMVKVGQLVREVLRDLIGREEGEMWLANVKGVEGVDDQSLRVLTYMACRSAVKAGDYLPMEERVRLLQNLSKCRIPYSCPHGRPVEVVVSLRELEKWFKRVV